MSIVSNPRFERHQRPNPDSNKLGLGRCGEGFRFVRTYVNGLQV